MRPPHLHPPRPINLLQHLTRKALTLALGPPIRLHALLLPLPRILLVDMPLRAADQITSLVVLDVEPVARRVAAVPCPLALLGFLNGGGAVVGGAAEDGEEDLHVGVVGVVVGGPFAVDDAEEGCGGGAFFEGEGHDDCFWFCVFSFSLMPYFFKRIVYCYRKKKSSIYRKPSESANRHWRLY